jgi:hypothetical protein
MVVSVDLRRSSWMAGAARFRWMEDGTVSARAQWTNSLCRHAFFAWLERLNVDVLPAAQAICGKYVASRSK